MTDGRQHVHAEKAEIMPHPQTRDDQRLLGFGRRRLFDDIFHFIQVVLPLDFSPADRAVKGEHAFTGGLDAGDRAVLGFGDAHQLLGAAALPPGSHTGDR